MYDKKDDLDDFLYSIDGLHKCEDANELITSSRSLVDYYRPYMDKRERCDDFVRGKHWTDEEEEIAEGKKKALIAFNYLKPSERTFVGSILQQRYDVKPAPREPLDQDKSDILSAMYHWTADTTRTKFYDPSLIRSCWSGGNAWQESYVEITPGKKPRIIVKNQNNYAIFPDPNRRDLVTNSDCEFIDRYSWLSVNKLASKFPDKEKEIRDALERQDEDSDYLDTKVYADRTHEYEDYRNGKYKVIERFYRVRKKRWFGINMQDGQREEFGEDLNYGQREEIKDQFPYYELNAEDEEYLYLAVTVPSMHGSFLYNDKYHCQPRDPYTGKIMFTIAELVDEELNGDPSGHVESQIDPLRLTNSLLTNKLHAAKHAAGQAKVISRDHFSENDIEDVAENHADSSRAFVKKKDAPQGPGVDIIPNGASSVEADDIINMSNDFRMQVSSTPPAMQGMSEGNIPGVLNEQRIQQSSVQSQVFITNYMSFMINRAKLWKYYWKKYFKAEDVIRVLEKKKDEEDWLRINQIVQDEFGNAYQEDTFADNDTYDITFEDSWKSPTVRDKVRRQVSELLGSVSVQQDPVLATYLTHFFLNLSDAPQEMKDLVEERSQVIQQSKAQEQQAQQQEQQMAQQGQELEQMERMQNIADREAQAEVPPLVPQSRQVLEAVR